jgi:hypothetical protein
MRGEEREEWKRKYPGYGGRNPNQPLEALRKNLYDYPFLTEIIRLEEDQSLLFLARNGIKGWKAVPGIRMLFLDSGQNESELGISPKPKDTAELLDLLATWTEPQPVYLVTIRFVSGGVHVALCTPTHKGVTHATLLDALLAILEDEASQLTVRAKDITRRVKRIRDNQRKEAK